MVLLLAHGSSSKRSGQAPMLRLPAQPSMPFLFIHLTIRGGGMRLVS